MVRGLLDSTDEFVFKRMRFTDRRDTMAEAPCYIDTLEPIPIRTKLHLRICDGMSTCELAGKVIYMHSGGGFGIFGVGVLFGEMGPEQQSTIDAWLRRLAGRPGKDLGKNSFSQIRG